MTMPRAAANWPRCWATGLQPVQSPKLRPRIRCIPIPARPRHRQRSCRLVSSGGENTINMAVRCSCDGENEAIPNRTIYRLGQMESVQLCYRHESDPASPRNRARILFCRRQCVGPNRSRDGKSVAARRSLALLHRRKRTRLTRRDPGEIQRCHRFTQSICGIRQCGDEIFLHRAGRFRVDERFIRGGNEFSIAATINGPA
jgi:hypothetical protein